MSYAILVLGGASPLGHKVSTELARQKHHFSSAAFLTHAVDAAPQQEDRYATIDLDRVVGDYSNPDPYKGFDVVLSATGDDGHRCGGCAQRQTEYIDAAFAAGVRHFYPNECESLAIRHIRTCLKHPGPCVDFGGQTAPT